ncbi:MAG: hypothetical protein ACE5JU_19850 [Candidatus Binatia bacterium]
MMEQPEKPPDEWTDEDWARLTAGERAITAPITPEPIDAKFVLDACHFWVPSGDLGRIATFTAADYRRLPVLVLITKILPRLTAAPLERSAEVELTIGEISYILHFHHGEDSYQGGKLFQERLLAALKSLLDRGGE